MTLVLVLRQGVVGGCGRFGQGDNGLIGGGQGIGRPILERFGGTRSILTRLIYGYLSY